MTIFVQGRTCDSNLYDIFLTPLHEDSFYDSVKDQKFNIDINHSSPESLNNNVISRWELGISGNINSKFKEELVSGVKGSTDLPCCTRHGLLSSIGKVFKHCPPAAARRLWVGIRAVVHLYGEETECDFMKMQSIEPTSIRCYLMREVETVKIEGGEREDKCALCLDEFCVGSEAAKLPCQHIFHGRCVGGWLKDRGTCPLCRSTILLLI